MKLTSILATTCAISALSVTAHACPATANEKKTHVATVYLEDGTRDIRRESQRANAQTPDPLTEPGSATTFAPNYDTGALDRS